jgi:site-specific DNA-methyltransferase (adenine-specific)
MPGLLVVGRRCQPVHTIVLSDNLPVLRSLPDGCVRLVYTDPPFNTGRRQHRQRVVATRDDRSPRRGFGGRRYRTTEVGSPSFGDAYDDYLAFLEPRLVEVRRALAPDGSLFLHLDWREVHYAKVLLDRLFGRASFMNEIVWAYDYGARTRRRWPAKHDTILWYARDPRRYVFDYESVDRVPYLAPSLAGPEKAARGKTPTDVWWQTVVSPTGREKTGYPTQKPLALAERIVRVHSRPRDLVLDCFAGSGTVGEAAARLGRRFLLVDESEEAAGIMRRRLAPWGTRVVRRLTSRMIASLRATE